MKVGYQACLNIMPSRSLSYAKIMQIESRTSNLFECYAEMQLILCKDKIFNQYNQTSFIFY